LPEAVIVRCKKLISYSSEFQDLMLDPDPERRVKADFFIELYAVIHDRDVAAFSWFKANDFTRQMLAKYREPPTTIKSVTDFRLIKQHITNARRIGAMTTFSKRLRRFAHDHAATLPTLEIEEASVHAEAKALVKKVSALQTLIRDLDPEQFYGEEDLWSALADLLNILEQKLKTADKRR
ncbi:MAG TPA: hypothetical protein VF551_07955, partial [Chthoniobacterales bacterium]